MKKEELQKLVSEVTEIHDALVKDTEKFIENNNKAASTRIRTGASTLTKKLKEVRAKVLEVRESL